MSVFGVILVRIFPAFSRNRTEYGEIRRYQNNSEYELFLRSEYVFKITWNAVRMTSKSKWLSHIANHVEGSCLVKAFDLCRFIKLSPLLLISVFTLENLRPLSKNKSQTHLNSIAPNPKNPETKSGKSWKILKYNVIKLKYLNIASKSFTA